VRSILEQCKLAAVPCFVKQLGAKAYDAAEAMGDNPGWLGLINRKGSDPADWPEDLRVREFPR
jgi:hypothetical protein